MPVQEPKRREFRRTHLDASVVPVERALNARAKEIEEGDLSSSANMSPKVVTAVQVMLAAEFRTLAEELHWW
jgi:hypothetical protein